jgi:hypothetical protein
MLAGMIKTERAIKISMSMIELFVGRLPGEAFEIISAFSDKSQQNI